MQIRTERVYDYIKRSRRSGEYVVLVDRLWPRGISKARLDIDEHLPDLGPSHELRKWFGHQPARWDPFKAKYSFEIQAEEWRRSELDRLLAVAQSGSLVLLYSARDKTYNQARALKDMMEGE